MPHQWGDIWRMRRKWGDHMDKWGREQKCCRQKEEPVQSPWGDVFRVSGNRKAANVVATKWVKERRARDTIRGCRSGRTLWDIVRSLVYILSHGKPLDFLEWMVWVLTKRGVGDNFKVGLQQLAEVLVEKAGMSSVGVKNSVWTSHLLEWGRPREEQEVWGRGGWGCWGFIDHNIGALGGQWKDLNGVVHAEKCGAEDMSETCIAKCFLGHVLVH